MLPSLAAVLPLLLPQPLQAQDGAPAARPWTLLVYGAADNNADGPILGFLHRVLQAIDDDPGLEVVLFLDRHEGYSDDARLLGEDFRGARLYRLRRDGAERLAGGEHFPEITLEGDPELDSADPQNLRRFVAFGKARFPAQRTGLLIYSHANGTSMCPDEASGRDMGIPEMGQVLTAAESVDFLALELCNMGGLEIAYEWRPGPDRFGADVLVAIPNAGPPLDWDRAFARIRTPGHASSAAGPLLDPATMTAEDFGRLVVEEGRRGREASEEPARASREAAACYDLREVAAVKVALDELAVALAASDSREVFLEMRGPGPIGDAINYTAGGPFVDLYDLCQRAAWCDGLSDEVRAASEAMLPAVDRFVLASFGMSAYEGFEDGKHGVFVVLPADGPDRWRELAWYTPLAHAEGKSHLGRWSFLADGATPANGKVETWFELLDSWFDAADDEGGGNGYRW